MKSKLQSTYLPLLLSTVLLLMVVAQNRGNIYGSYALFSWAWLLVVLLPLLLKILLPQYPVFEARFLKISPLLAMGFIFLQGLISIHPIYLLGIHLIGYLPLFFLQVYAYKTQTTGALVDSVNELKKLESIKVNECKNYIIKGRLNRAFDVLQENLDEKYAAYETFILLSQQWHKVERERTQGIMTTEQAGVENVRLTKALLQLLKTA